MSWRPGPAAAARLAVPILGALTRTWRIEVHHAERWATLQDAGQPFLFLLWHETLLPLLWHHQAQGVAIVVSEARDGQYLAELATRLGYQCVAGSSTRGGVRALLAAVRTLEGGTPVAFTPDGPRGPRRAIKSGILAAAQRTGSAILPIHAVANRAWRLQSWDRFMIPKPFARVRIGYGPPFSVDPGEPGIVEGASRAAEALGQLEREMGWPDAGATDIG